MKSSRPESSDSRSGLARTVVRRDLSHCLQGPGDPQSRPSRRQAAARRVAPCSIACPSSISWPSILNLNSAATTSRQRPAGPANGRGRSAWWRKNYAAAQTWRLWRGQFGSQPPFPIDSDTRAGCLLRQRRARLLHGAGLAAAAIHPRPVHRIPRAHQWPAERRRPDCRRDAISESTASTAPPSRTWSPASCAAGRGRPTIRPTSCTIAKATCCCWSGCCRPCCRALTCRAPCCADGS